MASTYCYSTELGKRTSGQCCQNLDDTSISCNNWIGQLAVFRDLSRLQLAEIASASKERSVPARQPIFCEDDPIRFVFIVISGRVKVTQLSRGGKEVILRIHGAGEIVDELCLMIGTTHRFSALPVESCQLLAWELRTFRAFTQRFPSLQLNLTNILASRLHVLQQRFCDLATERVPQRLARILVSLTEQGAEAGTNVKLIGLSWEELAQMTGTTVFTVSRLLSQWTECGIICTERKSIVVERLSDLSDLALGNDA
jgi:CRP-like cAMP-binding protein